MEWLGTHPAGLPSRHKPAGHRVCLYIKLACMPAAFEAQGPLRLCRADAKTAL